MGPDFVVLPTANGTEVRISNVRSASLLGGVEWAHKAWTISSYYGWTFFDRNFAPDDTAGAHPGAFVGFGGPNSANSNNKNMSELTLDGSTRSGQADRRRPVCRAGILLRLA